MSPSKSIPTVLTESSGDLVRSFGPLVVYEVLYRLAGFAIIAPFSAWLLRSLVGMTGRYALGNSELIAFAFSPIGLFVLLTTCALGVFNLFLQHAGAIIIADARTRGRRLSGFSAFWRVLLKMPGMVRLGLLQIARYALITIPVLGIVGTAYWFLWSDVDLYFLTNVRPPRFWAGVVIAGLAIGIGAVLLLRLFLRWLVALPLVLIEGRNARESLRLSHERTTGQTFRNLCLLSITTLAIALLGVIAAGLFALISGGVLGQVPDSLRLTIPILAALLGVHFLLFEAVEITGSIVVGLVIFRIAQEHGLVEHRKAKFVGSDREILRHLTIRHHLVRKVCIVVVAIVVMAGISALGLLATIGVSPTVTITAHRGDKRSAPENTLAAIRSAIASGADAAEIDVQLTSDGVVVVFHDDDLMRMANDPRRLADLTFEEARTFDVGTWFAPEFSGERIPTLDEVLNEASTQITLNIELKAVRGQQAPGPLVRGVIETLDRHNARSRCVISTLSYPTLAEVRRQAPDLRVGFIVFEAVGDPTRLDLDFLSVRDALATDDFIARARRRGRPVHVWTVDDPDRFVTFVNRGVADVITSDPALMVARRKELEGLNDLERLLLWYRRLLSDS